MKIFFCTTTKFPRGNAGANYILYLAKALKEEYQDIIVIGTGDYKSEHKTEEGYSYQGIPYYCIRKKRYFNSFYFNSLPKATIAILDQHSFSAGDIVITYAKDPYLLNSLKKYVTNRSGKIYGCITEWEQPWQFKKGQIDINYLMYRYMFEGILPQFTGVFPISGLLEEYYSSRGVSCLKLPILADPFEYKRIPRMEHSDKKVQFIYPGKAEIKDDYKTMITALATLPEALKESVELHFTGIGYDDLVRFMGDDTKHLKEIKEMLVLHSWMEYDDLITLYNSVDYLLLIRKSNMVTRANFPSKVPELMAYGVIPVCSAVGDYFTYLHDNEDSIIIFGEDVDTVRNAIEKAVLLPESKRSIMRENARNNVVSTFYYKNWTKTIVEYLKDH